ncbi:MAG: hypothetical protein ACK4NA_12610 [Alphaproteobacteria bacterium]
MKAEMNVGDQVHVEPVGINATITSVVPVWSIASREPIDILYEVGLGRLFKADELLPLYPQA